MKIPSPKVRNLNYREIKIREHSVMVAHQPLRLDGGLPILGMGSIPIALAKIEKISKVRI